MNEIREIALKKALLMILRPLVRILLRNGVVFSVFSELVKKVYVDVAFDEHGESGKKQTISRVAALTGLTRKETKRLHDLKQPLNNVTGNKYNRASRVISGWLNDAEFSDAPLHPSILSVEGDRGSFAALVKRYSGDIPTKAMLDVLNAAGNVVISERGVMLVQHAFVPQADEIAKLSILGADTAELISTLNHNLVCDADQLWFQRKVSNSLIQAKDLPLFQAYAAEHSQALLEQFNLWLGEQEIPEGEDESDCHYVSLGIYYYQNKLGNQDDEVK
ncbi:DUF6502 family protein [Motilimonas sp. E26]|uniref:DUF6502 family protein n=1 Tax=Motilimonas TaxID=1914248 RepID=UPI001E645BC7|nr:DUF6502 family protein [Motilimonas sp. E26]MCE0558931.1 hypothetical protein [Motilimonas sp. E26]